MKKLLATLIISIILLLNGCGDGNKIKVSESNYNDVFGIVNEVSNNFNIQQPDVYIHKGGTHAKPCIFAKCVKYIIIDKKDYDILSKEELKALIVHEVAHKDDNWFYRFLSNYTRSDKLPFSIPLVFIIIALAVFFGLLSDLRLGVVLFIISIISMPFISVYAGRVNEVKADIEALKQTDLVTMKHMLFKIYGRYGSICGEFKESDLNEVSDASWEKEKGKFLGCVWRKEALIPHPYFTHRILILKKADKLIKEGKEPLPVWNKPSLNENEIEVSTNY